MKYTPKQMVGFQTLASIRKRREALHDLQLTALATQGTPRAIKAQIAELKKALRGT